MRVLVCGGREFDDWDLFCETMKRCGFIDREVLDKLVIIEGGAKGADFIARVWAKWLRVAHLPFPADWKTHGKYAGGKRNAQMLSEGRPDLVIAFPGGRGTADMVRQAREAGVEVKEIGYN